MSNLNVKQFKCQLQEMNVSLRTHIALCDPAFVIHKRVRSPPFVSSGFLLVVLADWAKGN